MQKVVNEDEGEKVDTPSRKLTNKFAFGQEPGFGVQITSSLQPQTTASSAKSEAPAHVNTDKKSKKRRLKKMPIKLGHLHDASVLLSQNEGKSQLVNYKADKEQE